MAEPFVTVATYSALLEAEMARNRLEAEGIRAFALGDKEAATTLNILGPAVGQIQVQVRAGDLQRAGEILARIRDRATDALPLPSTCANCGRLLDAPDAFCLVCDSSIGRASERSSEDADLRIRSEELQEMEGEPPLSLAEQAGERAFKAAIIGLLMCPPLLNVYSLWLLLRFMADPGEVRPAVLRKALAALVIDVLGFLWAFGLLRLMF